ncbi:GTPase-associated system all-helical protein GASH [Terriglobus albidus]|uniref:GTPase-associated system all-helical protein GASH n=1 Tax=Terriglobus albidus TaxID=1592106 RepID=UPI0021E0145B|nr:GTPase-associated system all-helical protein GASH [Terriglobus albidus]
MHAHLIDWYRNVHIQPDPKIVEKRWDTAAKYSKRVTKASLCALLRLFLFSQTDHNDKTFFQEALLEIDPEFPVANNEHELRLMAGVVMVTAFKAKDAVAIGFALGLKATLALKRDLDIAQPAILKEAEHFLMVEAEAKRPDRFGDVGSEEVLLDRLKKLNSATDETFTAAQSAFYKELIKTIKQGRQATNSQLLQLSEETALLWWIVNEYSDRLKTSTALLSKLEYAIAAAIEAAERTQILPPSNSMNALLARSLKHCVDTSDEPQSFRQLLEATKERWQAITISPPNPPETKGLLPISTALSKVAEFDNVAGAVQVLSHLCPGLNVETPISATEVAQAAYAEITFLKALSLLG